MDLLIILTYTAICVGIFKVFKIPLNKWTVPTAVLGGIIVVGTLIFLMNYNHPYSEASREYFATTPVIPSVTGRVVEVTTNTNTLLNKGDVLFRIDPIPFENKVNALQARLKSAEADLSRAITLKKTGVGKGRDVDLTQANVDDLRAQLADAEYNLEQTTVRAPTAGYVTQVILRPGMMAAQLPLRPVMVFVHHNENHFIGWYRQNSMLRLKAGFEAEVAFDGIPGKVFSGKVVTVLPALAEGQMQATGNLADMSSAMRPGRIPVVIKIDDPEFEQYRSQIPSGAYGQSAIYSDQMRHVAIMRKIILRMSSWMNYFFPFH